MPLIEQELDPDEAARARATAEYHERMAGRGADAPGLFADVNPSDPLPDWLAFAEDEDDER